MRLESVRALKAEVTETIVRPMIAEALESRRFGVQTRSLSVARRAAPRGIALGIAKAGRRDYRLAVRLQSRAFENDGLLREKLGSLARGEADIRYVGKLAKQTPAWSQVHQRPLLIGCSVAHPRVTAGTLGGFMSHRASGRLVLVSNNHVLANEDRAEIGDAVYQPGPYDGGGSSDRVGTLTAWAPLRRPGPNLVDAAIAEVDDGIDVDLVTVTGAATPFTGVRTSPIEPGEAVFKVGRTTQMTQGLVTAIEVDSVVVNYEIGELSFDRQIELEGAGDAAFSAGGDSGSFVADDNGEVFGLLFAGGDVGGSNGRGLTYVNDMSSVMSHLDLEWRA